VPTSVSPVGTPAVSVTEPVQAWFVNEYLSGWTQKFGAFTGPLIWFTIRDLGTNASGAR
jgi:hypothetical protein